MGLALAQKPTTSQEVMNTDIGALTGLVLLLASSSEYNLRALLRSKPYIYLCMHTYICTYIHMHKHGLITCMYVCMHACMHLCMYVCACMHVYYIYIYTSQIHVYYICIHTHSHTYKVPWPPSVCAVHSSRDCHPELLQALRLGFRGLGFRV